MLAADLDAFDCRILSELQGDGRLSNVELADRVGLSASPCLRRVRRLEEAGVIRGYRATLDRAGVGLELTAFVSLRIEGHHDERTTAVQEAIRAIPEVVACWLVSGEADFLLEVVLPGLGAYERLLLGKLARLPGVKDIRTSFAMREVKPRSPLPLAHLDRRRG